ncbi:MAG TPA: EamA family transporter [Acidimicrobiales bacterium]|nr:EamA family transporter [Acidimicrobiales bacterium]
MAGYAAVIAAAALWAVAAVVARRLFDAGVSPIELTESRALVAVAGFALVPGAWRRRPGGRPADVIALGIAVALVNATYYVAISRIPVAVALVVQYTAPALIVAWAAAVSRRAPSADVLVALAAALIGVVLVVDLAPGAIGRIDGLGLAIAVASAVLFASYTVLAERTGAVYGSTPAMLRAFAVASLLWIVFQAPRGIPDELVLRANLPEVLYVGLAGTLAPFLLFAWGVGRIRAERAAIAATLEPVIAAVVAWAWLGQRLSVLQLVGGALVVGAVVSLQVRRRRPLVAPEI